MSAMLKLVEKAAPVKMDHCLWFVGGFLYDTHLVDRSRWFIIDHLVVAVAVVIVQNQY